MTCAPGSLCQHHTLPQLSCHPFAGAAGLGVITCMGGLRRGLGLDRQEQLLGSAERDLWLSDPLQLPGKSSALPELR